MTGGVWKSRVAGLRERLMKWVLQRNYSRARAHYHRRLYRRSLQYKKPPLLIYQMGKVGSKTIRSTLQASKLDRPIYHVHLLTPDRIEQLEADRRKYLGTGKEHLLKHIWQYQYLRTRMTDDLKGHKWKIVTLTREPVGRNISTFFENLDVAPMDADGRFHVKSDYYGFDIVLDEGNPDELMQLFFES